MTRDKKRARRWGWIKRINPLLAVSMLVVVITLVAAVLPGLLAPYNPERMDLRERSKSPSASHPFGTDQFGRDVLSRVIYGAQVSIYVGLLASVLASITGATIGLIAGFYGRWIDAWLMRVVDIMLAFPSILLALLLVAILGPSLNSLVISIGITYSPRMARLARAGTLTVKTEAYVEAARAIGAGNPRILARHILPNIVGPLLVQASMILPIAILVEATLSFLGLGVQPPTPSWGNMLNAGRASMEVAPWLTIFPGLAISVLVISVNLLGDAAQDWANPRLHRR